jgi:hypothetical protein
MKKHRINDIMKNIIIFILFYVSYAPSKPDSWGQSNRPECCSSPLSSFMPPHKIARTILVIGHADLPELNSE